MKQIYETVLERTDYVLQLLHQKYRTFGEEINTNYPY